jgi:hypothetical protein
MQPIKLIKNAERKVPKTQSMIKSALQNRSPQGVQSWVIEFKRTRRAEALISFESLFKNALSQPAREIETPIFSVQEKVRNDFAHLLNRGSSLE